MGLLAPSPASFLNCQQIIPCDVIHDFSLTTKGLSVKLPLSEDRLSRRTESSSMHAPSLLLPCRPRDDRWSLVSLPLLQLKTGVYGRRNLPIRLVSHQKGPMWPRRRVDLLLQKSVTTNPSLNIKKSPGVRRQKLWIRDISRDLRFLGVLVDVQEKWLADSRIIKMRTDLSNLRDYLTEDSSFAIILVENRKSSRIFGIVLDIWQPPSFSLPFLFPGFWWINHRVTPIGHGTANGEVSTSIRSSNSSDVSYMSKYISDTNGIIHAHVSHGSHVQEATHALDIELIPHGYQSLVLRTKYSLTSLPRKGAHFVSILICRFSSYFRRVVPRQILVRRVNFTAHSALRWFELSFFGGIITLYVVLWFWCLYFILWRLPNLVPPSEDIFPPTSIFFHVLYLLLPIVAYSGRTSPEFLQSRRAILSLLLSLAIELAVRIDTMVAYWILIGVIIFQRDRITSEMVRGMFYIILTCVICVFLLGNKSGTGKRTIQDIFMEDIWGMEKLRV